MPQAWSAERSETGRSRSSQRLAIQIVKPTFLRRSMIGSTGGQRAFAGAAGNGEVAPENEPARGRGARVAVGAISFEVKRRSG
jgi:hypothetical protein